MDWWVDELAAIYYNRLLSLRPALVERAKAYLAAVKAEGSTFEAHAFDAVVCVCCVTSHARFVWCRDCAGVV
jgi:hypothetical protein